MSTITTLLRFQVDNRDAKRKLEEIRKKQQDVENDAEKHAKLSDERFRAQIDGWAKMAGGMLAVIGMYKTLAAGAEKYAQISRLQHAAVGADIERLSRASGGLLTNYELLTGAAASLNGKFKLSQQEMETVARAAVNIRNRLGDETTGGLTAIYKDLTKAIVESNTEGLKKFGINVAAQQGTIEAHTAAIKALADENFRAGENILRTGDEAQIASTKWANALDALVFQLGRISIALTPIVEAMADLVNGLAQVGELPGFLAREGRIRDTEEAFRARGGTLAQIGRRKYAQLNAAAARQARRGPGLLDEEFLAFDSVPAALVPSAGVGVGGARGAGSAGGELLTFGGYYGGQTAPLVSRVGFTGDFSGISGIDFGSVDAVSRFTGYGGTGAQRGAADAISGDLFKGAKGALGGASQFDAIIQGSEMAQMALGTLQQAGVAAFTAMATGADGMGRAIRRALADGVLAMGSQLTAKAVYHGIYALGELAFGDLPGAALHAKTAGEAAAGAAALAVIARGMGAGQRGGAGGGGYGGALPGAAAGAFGAGGGVNTERVYVVPVGLDDDPRSTRKRIADSMDRANRENGGTSTVDYR